VSVFPQVVTRNWRLKLSAMALALFLWAVVTIQPRNREVLPNVPVQVVVSDPDWVLAEPPTPATVSVNLGGLTRELLDLPRGSEAFVRVPIDRIIAEDTVVRLRTDWVVLSGGSNLVVQDITPVLVTLRFEPTRTTALPLSLRTTNELPEDLALAAQLGLSPQVTTVRGPARIVETLDSINLEPLDLSQIRASGRQGVRVDTTGFEGLTFSPPTAQVSVNVQPAVERVLRDVPVVIEPPAGVDATLLLPDPRTVDVTLRGAITPVNQVNEGALVAFIAARDLEGIAPGSEWVAPIRIRGVGSLVRARSAVDSVRVVRALVPPVLPTDTTLPPDTVRPDTIVRPDTVPRAHGPGGGW
jgi:YbbR domain-containing protein